MITKNTAGVWSNTLKCIYDNSELYIDITAYLDLHSLTHTYPYCPKISWLFCYLFSIENFLENIWRRKVDQIPNSTFIFYFLFICKFVFNSSLHNTCTSTLPLPSQYPQYPASTIPQPSQYPQYPASTIPLPSQYPQYPASTIPLPSQYPQYPASTIPLPSQYPQNPASTIPLPSQYPQYPASTIPLPSQYPQYPASTLTLTIPNTQPAPLPSP